MSVRDKVIAIAVLDSDILTKIDEIIPLASSTLRSMIDSDDYLGFIQAPRPKAISSVVDSGVTGQVTVTCPSHGLSVDDIVRITGVVDSYNYNEETAVASVADVNTFNLYLEYDAVADNDEAMLITKKRDDYEYALAYITLYHFSILMRELIYKYPFAESLDFGQGRVTLAKAKEITAFQDMYLAQARMRLNPYLTTTAFGIRITTVNPTDGELTADTNYDSGQEEDE